MDREPKLTNEAELTDVLDAEGALGAPELAHAWVGVDGDGTVFCTRIDTPELGEQKRRAIGRALERLRYEPAVVLGRPHYRYLHVDLPLWGRDHESACRWGVHDAACRYAAAEHAEKKNHAAEAEMYLLGCERDDPGACVGAGESLAKGHGIAKDVARGEALLQKACDKNPWYCGALYDAVLANGSKADRLADLAYRACEAKHPGACKSAGWHYQHGKGVERDVERATALYDEACSRRSIEGCARLARRLDRGIGTKPDAARARMLRERLCAKDPGRCLDLARTQLVAGDVAAAAATYRRACDASDKTASAAPACLKLHHLAKRHPSVPPVDAQAIAAREEERCEKEDTMCALASQLEEHVAEAPDLEKNRRLLERGCAHDFFDSCRLLTRLLIRTKDLSNAKPYAEKSCRSGATWSCGQLAAVGFSEEQRFAILEDTCKNREDCWSLAEALATRNQGNDGPRALGLATSWCDGANDEAHGCHTLARVVALVGDPATRDAQAAAHLRTACDGGDGEACVELAARYRSGVGVVVNLERARKLELRGCDLDLEMCAAYESSTAAARSGVNVSPSDVSENGEP